MTNKFNLKQGIKKYYPLGFLFLIILSLSLIQGAKAKEISVGTTSDNIGIGTDTPGTTYRLNVNGNSNITGTLNVTGGITGSSLGATLLNASNISAGTFGSNSGGGNYSFPGTLNVTSGVVSATVGGNTNPGSTAFQAREYNYGTTAIDHIEQNAPRIGFHWGNRYWGQITYFNSIFSFRNSDLSGYAPIAAGDIISNGTVNWSGGNSSHLGTGANVTTYEGNTSVNNALVRSNDNNNDAWVMSWGDSGGWGIYNRNIDAPLAVSGALTVPANSTAFIGGGLAKAYIDHANGNAGFAGTVNAAAYNGPITSTPGGGYITPSDGLNSSLAYDRMTYYDGYGGAVTNGPGQAWVGALTIGAANRGLQIAGGYSGDVYYRNGAGGWGGWNKFISSSNYNSYAPTLSGGGASGTWGINVTGNAGSSGYSTTHYVGGQQLNPQTYFNDTIGLKVAMTGYPIVWADTLWINGYPGGDVRSMIALHTARNGQPRMWLSSQASNSTSFGTAYEFITDWNIASQSVAKVNGIASNPDNSHPGTGMRPFYSWNTGQANNASAGYSNGISVGSNPGDQFYGFQIVQNMWDDNLYFRRYNAGWQTWYSVVYKDSSNNSTIGGTMTAAGFVYNSDVKLKKNIATIESPLTKILQLRGVTFNWKKDNQPGVGLIAQEVEKVFPELVSESGGIKSVQYGNLVAPLIEAVKEQQTEIQNQQTQINEMKAQIQMLQAKN